MKITVLTDSQPVYVIRQATTLQSVNEDIEISPLPGDGDSDGSDEPITPLESLPITLDGQTVFQLSRVAPYPERSRLYVNGLKASFGSSYIIDGSILRWSDVGYTLQISDILEVIY